MVVVRLKLVATALASTSALATTAPEEPFEGAGVISKWRIKLPDTFKQFDYDTMTGFLAVGCEFDSRPSYSGRAS